MAIKVFKQKGPTDYRSKKLVKALEQAIEAEIKKNPDFAATFKPATNVDELKAYYDKYCVTDAEIISETPNDTTVNTNDMGKKKDADEFTLSDEKKTNLGDTKTNLDSDNPVFDNPDFNIDDPMNRANPKVRGYVMDDSMNPDDEAAAETGNTNTFKEPTNAAEAFTLPNDETQHDYGMGDKPRRSKTKDADGESKKERSEPINPNFGDQDNKSRNKKTKRMAKYIVGAFCAILENGVPFLVTRDITVGAIAAAAKNKEIDLTIILQLDAETQCTVAEFFTMMRKEAKEIGKIPKDKQEDLIEDLYDLLIEKGVTPTPMQSIALSLLEIAAMVGFKALSFRSQISQVKAIAAPVKPSKQKQAQNIIDHLQEEVNKKQQTKTPEPEDIEEEETEEEELQDQTETTSDATTDHESEDSYAGGKELTLTE
ncbi:MAG: hypothetical protein V4547_18005 [Bacteroidota bacterium]